MGVATTIANRLSRFVGNQIERELRSGSRVLWDSVRAATYAPFLVATGLLLGHYIDEQHWSYIAIGTVAADGLKHAASTAGSMALNAIKSVVGAHDDDADDGSNGDGDDHTG
jgi:hypothetical protein